MDKSRFPETYESSEHTKVIGEFHVGESKTSSRGIYYINAVNGEYQLASEPSVNHIFHSNHLLLVMQHCIKKYSTSTKLPIQLICFFPNVTSMVFCSVGQLSGSTDGLAPVTTLCGLRD